MGVGKQKVLFLPPLEILYSFIRFPQLNMNNT